MPFRLRRLTWLAAIYSGFLNVFVTVLVEFTCRRVILKKRNSIIKGLDVWVFGRHFVKTN